MIDEGFRSINSSQLNIFHFPHSSAIDQPFNRSVFLADIVHHHLVGNLLPLAFFECFARPFESVTSPLVFLIVNVVGEFPIVLKHHSGTPSIRAPGRCSGD